MLLERKLNFGIIGCGMIAVWHADAMNALCNRTDGTIPILTGTADKNFTYAEVFAKKYGVRAYNSIDELLADADINAVCICTPNGTHASLALDALRMGKHVLIEKPLALSVEDCDTIIAEAERRGLCAGVVSQRRYSDTIIELSELLREDIAGVPISAELSIRYYRDNAYYSKGSWHGTRDIDGGVLMNQGIHGIDIMLDLMGEVERVHAFTANRIHDIQAEDTICASLKFKNGALGTVYATTAAYPGFPQRLTVTFEKGSVTLKENEIEEWSIAEAPRPMTKGLSAGGFGAAADISVDGHIAQISDFADAVYECRDPRVTLNDGRRAVELIKAIYSSADEHTEIEI